MQHPVIWFEVMGNDGPKLQKFYKSLFGWKMYTDNPMQYGMVEPVGKGIPGGVGQGPEPDKSWVTFYVGTDNAEASLGRANKLGADTVMPPTKMPDGVTLAMFRDPEGHIIGLAQESAEQK